jgi:putative solute:sodium symporter small subunit
MKNVLKAVWFILSFSIPTMLIYDILKDCSVGNIELNSWTIVGGPIMMFILLKYSLKIYKSL